MSSSSEMIVMVTGAGGKGAALNGGYERKDTVNGKPVFVSDTGALLYFRGYWKINTANNGGLWGWIYGDPRGGDRELPTTGVWRCDGSQNGENLPHPKIEMVNPNRAAHRLSRLAPGDAVAESAAAEAVPIVANQQHNGSTCASELEPVSEPTEDEIAASVRRSRDQIRARAEAEAQRALAENTAVTLRRSHGKTGQPKIEVGARTQHGLTGNAAVTLRRAHGQAKQPIVQAEAESPRALTENAVVTLRRTRGPARSAEIKARPSPTSSASFDESATPVPAAKRAPVPRPRPVSTLVATLSSGDKQYQRGAPSSPMAPKAAALTFAAGTTKSLALPRSCHPAPVPTRRRKPAPTSEPASKELHSFKMVTKALVASGLGEVLGSSDSSYTLLAPTDVAFEKFAEEWGLSGDAYIEEISTNSQLQRQIRGLVIKGKISSDEISQKKKLRAINGDLVRCGQNGQKIELDGGFEAELIRRDHACGNGFIHVIG